jgi:hypothetical protein
MYIYIYHNYREKAKGDREKAFLASELKQQALREEVKKDREG